MYTIKCDDSYLHHPNFEGLTLINPKCKLEANTVGEASFTILSNHPNYTTINRLKSIIEVRQNDEAIFRGYVTSDSSDFYNKVEMNVEGVLGFTNDTIIEPFNFPADFPEATESENIVKYFLNWVIEQHNAQVEEWQQLKLGTVTVTDNNNYITRSSDSYLSTWEIIKTKLFESALEGYILMRYENDGNYIDYVSDFTLTNAQQITFDRNLIDYANETNTFETYSAMLPLGAKVRDESNLTLEGVEDGDLTDDIVKIGKYIYSKSARELYGWRCAPTSTSTWEDVTEVENLKEKSIEALTTNAMLLSNTITIKAVDLHLTDLEIEAFRIGKNIHVFLPMYNLRGVEFKLTKLEPDISNPQNTTLTIGDTVKTLTGRAEEQQREAINQLEKVEQQLRQSYQSSNELLQEQLLTQNTSILNTCSEIIFTALEQYIQTSEYAQFKEIVETQLSIITDDLLKKFTSVNENITNIDGSLEAKFTELYKYIDVSNNVPILRSNDGIMSITIENNGIVFKKNNVQFGYWDGVNFHTGSIIVRLNEKAQFGNFAFVPQSDGSLMFLKVGG